MNLARRHNDFCCSSAFAVVGFLFYFVLLIFSIYSADICKVFTVCKELGFPEPPKHLPAGVACPHGPPQAFEGTDQNLM